MRKELEGFDFQYAFTNIHGEEFYLKMLNNEVGIIRGHETDWNDIYLVNGWGINFNIWGDEEKEWLSQYFNLNPDMPGKIRFSILKNNKDKGYSFLEDSEGRICPCCLRKIKQSEKHHVIAAMYGGSDSYQTVLEVCNSCHALETKGDDRHLYSISLTLLHHQVYHFKDSFFLCQVKGNSRYKDRHIKHWNKRTWKVIKHICKQNGKYYKEHGEYPDWYEAFSAPSASGSSFLYTEKMRYFYFRQVFLDVIPFEYILDNIIEK